VCKDLQKGSKVNFYSLPVPADETMLNGRIYIANGAEHRLEPAVGEEGPILTCNRSKPTIIPFLPENVGWHNVNADL